MSETFPRLLGDVGGTNARLGWQATQSSGVQHVQVLPCADYPSLEVAIQTYLQQQNLPAPRACALGIANPITGDTIRMTNHHWTFSISEMARNLGLLKLNVINDFTALALAIPSISPAQLVQVGGQHALDFAPKAIIGAGTGLGVSGLFPVKAGRDQWVAIAGEGGHASLAAHNETEYRVIELIRQRYGPVSRAIWRSPWAPWVGFIWAAAWCRVGWVGLRLRSLENALKPRAGFAITSKTFQCM